MIVSCLYRRYHLITYQVHKYCIFDMSSIIVSLCTSPCYLVLFGLVLSCIVCHLFCTVQHYQIVSSFCCIDIKNWTILSMKYNIVWHFFILYVLFEKNTSCGLWLNFSNSSRAFGRPTQLLPWACYNSWRARMTPKSLPGLSGGSKVWRDKNGTDMKDFHSE